MYTSFWYERLNHSDRRANLIKPIKIVFYLQQLSHVHYTIHRYPCNGCVLVTTCTYCTPGVADRKLTRPQCTQAIHTCTSILCTTSFPQISPQTFQPETHKWYTTADSIRGSHTGAVNQLCLRKCSFSIGSKKIFGRPPPGGLQWPSNHFIYVNLCIV